MSSGKQHAMSRTVGRFDAQAHLYDQRTRLDEAAGRAVAGSVLDIAGGMAVTVVEIGAGTGELGRHFAAMPCRYVGLDLSRAMLAVFRAKLVDGEAETSVIQTDCNDTWPIRDSAADAVLASRVVHLLDGKCFAREAQRVCRPGAHLVIGRVEHDAAGLRGQLRRMRRRLLEERGVVQRSGGEGGRQVIEHCVAAGAQLLQRKEIAAWVRTVCVGEVIDGWDAAAGWADGTPGARVHAEVQALMRAWSTQQYSSLSYSEPCTQRYNIDTVRFP